MESEILPLDPAAPFRFRCGPQVPCFNACCRDLVQLLSPLDVIRLKQHLAMTATTFLERYTVSYPGPETGLPVVSLAPAPGSGGVCPFVQDAGCRVYPARPTSCRTYPVARAISRCRQTGRLSEHFALIREPHCKGFDQPGAQTIGQWLEAQAASADFAVTDGLMDIIQLKNRLRPGPLAPEEMTRCRMALYDMDRFREFINTEPVIAGRPIEAGQWKTAQSDDLALLTLAMAWVRHYLFGQAPD
ncbi:MAG: YkgJ family cysteine cluster protein [Pseudomonadota bacterium]